MGRKTPVGSREPKREFLPVQTVDDVIDNARYAEEVLNANGKYYNATEMAKLLGAKSAAALNAELKNAGIIYKTMMHG